MKIIIGKPISRDQLPKNDGDAIKQLKKLSDSLKDNFQETVSPVVGLTPKFPTIYPNNKGVVINPPSP